MMPDCVREHIFAGDLIPTDMAVLDAILKHARQAIGDGASAWTTKAKIAKDLDLSRRTVQSSIQRLKACGLIDHLAIGPDLIDPRNKTGWRFFFLWVASVPEWAKTAAKTRRGEKSAASPELRVDEQVVSPSDEQAVSPNLEAFGSQQTEAKADDDREPPTRDESPSASPSSLPSSSSSSIGDQDSDFWVELVGPPPPGPGWKDRPSPPAFSEPDRPSPPSPSPSPKPQTTAARLKVTWVPAQEPSLNTPEEVAGIVQRMRKAFPGLDNIEARATEVLRRCPTKVEELGWAIDQAQAKKKDWKYACGIFRNWQAGDGIAEPPQKPKPAPMQNYQPLSAESRKPRVYTPEEIAEMRILAAGPPGDAAARLARATLQRLGLATGGS